MFDVLPGLMRVHGRASGVAGEARAVESLGVGLKDVRVSKRDCRVEKRREGGVVSFDVSFSPLSEDVSTVLRGREDLGAQKRTYCELQLLS